MTREQFLDKWIHQSSREEPLEFTEDFYGILDDLVREVGDGIMQVLATGSERKWQ